MENLTDFIKEKKTIFGLIILALILLSLPLTIKLAQDSQIFKSRAEEPRKSCGFHKDLETWWDSCSHDDTDNNLYKQYQYICGDGTTSRLEWRSCTSTNPGGGENKDTGSGASSACQLNPGITCNGFFYENNQCIEKYGGYCAAAGETGVAIDAYGCVANYRVVDRSNCGLTDSPTSTPALTPPQGGVPINTPVPTSASSGNNPPAGSTKTCLGSRTWADIYDGVKKAGYQGSFDNSQIILDVFNKTSCPNGSNNGPVGSITCKDNSSCTVNQFNNDRGMGTVNLDIAWQNWKECQDPGVIPSGETLCYYVAAELCETSDDPQRQGQKPLLASIGNSLSGDKVFPNGTNKVGPIWWVRPGYTYTYKLYETGYTCTSTQNCTESGEWDRRPCKGIQVAQVTVKGNSTQTPSTKTAFYRISTRSFTDDSGWQRYKGHPLGVENFDLGNITPGADVVVHVQFKSTTGQIASATKKIKYIGPDPKLTSTKCTYSPTGVGTQVEILGENLGEKGSKGKVIFNEKETKVSSWTSLPSASSSASLVKGPTTFWKIVASIQDKLQGSLPIPLRIETEDGRGDATTCTISLTTLSFNAKSECRPGTDMAAENIKVQIREIAKGAKPIFNQNINLNAEGQPIWTPPVLEVGKKYIVAVRGPKALGHKVEIEAKEGTNVLNEFRMLIGDIAPASSPDNRVNTLDYGLLLGQWTIAKDSSKSADFNLDKRVNSIDYACMRQNFNKNGEEFPSD